MLFAIDAITTTILSLSKGPSKTNKQDLSKDELFYLNEPF